MIYAMSMPKEYEEALEKVTNSYNVNKDDKIGYDTFCLAFLEGWLASKNHTLKMINSLSIENKDE